MCPVRHAATAVRDPVIRRRVGLCQPDSHSRVGAGGLSRRTVPNAAAARGCRHQYEGRYRLWLAVGGPGPGSTLVDPREAGVVPGIDGGAGIRRPVDDMERPW